MVIFGNNIIIKIEGFAHINTRTVEWTTGVQDNTKVYAKLHQGILKKTTEDNRIFVMNKYINKNYDISHIAFINAMLPLLSVYLSGIQRST